MSEIKIDIDHRDRGIVIDTLNKIISDYKPLKLRLFISPTGRGYHIKFIVNDDFSVCKLIHIRKILGDDPNRISMVGRNYRDVLFEIKMVNSNVFRAKEIDVGAFIKDGMEVCL